MKEIPGEMSFVARVLFPVIAISHFTSFTLLMSFGKVWTSRGQFSPRLYIWDLLRNQKIYIFNSFKLPPTAVSFFYY